MPMKKHLMKGPRKKVGTDVLLDKILLQLKRIADVLEWMANNR
jgi:hypothetical protein